MKQTIKTYLVATLCGGCMLALGVLFAYLSVWYIVNYSIEKNSLYYIWCGVNILWALSLLLGSYVISHNIIDDGL